MIITLHIPKAQQSCPHESHALLCVFLKMYCIILSSVYSFKASFSSPFLWWILLHPQAPISACAWPVIHKLVIISKNLQNLSIGITGDVTFFVSQASSTKNDKLLSFANFINNKSMPHISTMCGLQFTIKFWGNFKERLRKCIYISNTEI